VHLLFNSVHYPVIIIFDLEEQLIPVRSG
jgi:hypothetical protein